MTLVIYAFLIMNNDGSNLCKVFQCTLWLCIKSRIVMTLYESNQIMLELILSCDSSKILLWVQLWFNKI